MRFGCFSQRDSWYLDVSIEYLSIERIGFRMWTGVMNRDWVCSVTARNASSHAIPLPLLHFVHLQPAPKMASHCTILLAFIFSGSLENIYIMCTIVAQPCFSTLSPPKSLTGRLSITPSSVRIPNHSSCQELCSPMPEQFQVNRAV